MENTAKQTTKLQLIERKIFLDEKNIWKENDEL